MARTFKILTVEDIIEINRRMIKESGGFHNSDNNSANLGPLEHILDVIQGSVFGVNLYPSIFEKAGAIAWRIITEHVFFDGNKRTGMEACRNFLEQNGYNMRIDFDIIDVAIDIAEKKVEFYDFILWLKKRTSSL